MVIIFVILTGNAAVFADFVKTRHSGVEHPEYEDGEDVFLDVKDELICAFQIHVAHHLRKPVRATEDVPKKTFLDEDGFHVVLSGINPDKITLNML